MLSRNSTTQVGQERTNDLNAALCLRCEAIASGRRPTTPHADDCATERIPVVGA